MTDLSALLAQHGSLLVFVATLAARIGAPVPAVPFLVVAGAMSVGGAVSLPLALLGALLGNLVGDGAWFLAGRRWGYRVLRLLCRISLSPDSCVRRSESILGRWGGLSLLAAKFVPGVSVVAPPMAGALGMSNARFVGYELFAALVWSGGFLLLGRLFHSAVQDVLSVFAQVGLAAGLFCLLALAGFVGWRWNRRRLALRTGDIERIDAASLRAAIAAGTAPGVIDVRMAAARTIDPRSIPGAIGLALRDLPQALGEWADGRELVVFCDCPNDLSAIAAARALMAAGLSRVRVLEGGLDAWRASESQPEAAPERGGPGELEVFDALPAVASEPDGLHPA